MLQNALVHAHDVCEAARRLQMKEILLGRIDVRGCALVDVRFEDLRFKDMSGEVYP